MVPVPSQPVWRVAGLKMPLEPDWKQVRVLLPAQEPAQVSAKLPVRVLLPAQELEQA